MAVNRYILLPEGSPEVLIEKFSSPGRDKLLKRLFEQCEYYFKQELFEEHPTSNITGFGYAAANLSLAYLITKQPYYLEELKRWAKTAINYNHWGKATLVDTGLDAGWILFGLSLSYNWVGDFLSSAEKENLKNKLILQGSRLYDYSIENEGQFWSSVYWQSHNWVCYTALYTAGIALIDDYPDAELWIKKARRNFDIVLSVLSDDGSYFPGLRYWRYSLPWLITYMDIVKKIEGVDLFKGNSFMRNTFYFALYQITPTFDEIINFGDCINRRSGHSIAVYYKLASEYRLGHAQWLGKLVSDKLMWKEEYYCDIGQDMLPDAFLELLWFDESVIPEKPDNLPLVKYFYDLGLVVIRDSWDENATHFSFKASPPGGHKAWKIYHRELNEKGWMVNIASHQHPDNNSFILFSNGSFLAIDDGLVNSKFTKNHNTVIIDNKGYANEGTYDAYYNLPFEAQANIEEFIAKNNYVYTQGEASKLYSPHLKLDRFARSVLYSGNGYFIIMDELKSSIPHTYTWLLHSDHLFEKKDENIFKTSKGLGELFIHCIEPKKIYSTIEDVKISTMPLSTTPNLVLSNKHNVLRIENIRPVENIQFLNIIRTEKLYNSSNINIINISNSSCIGIIIEREDSKEIFLWARVKSTEIIYKNIRSDGKWVSLCFANDGLVRFGMFQGSILYYNDEIIENLKNKDNVFKNI